MNQIQEIIYKCGIHETNARNDFAAASVLLHDKSMEVFKAGISCHISLNFQDQDAQLSNF